MIAPANAKASRVALVVDDSTSMRSMVAFTLKQAGFTVLESVNGKDALTALDKAGSQAPVRLIITDLNMPVMDGMTFIKQARTRSAHKFTPILMLTTEAGDGKKQEGRAAGATGWLVKPFNPEQLLAVVGKVLP